MVQSLTRPLAVPRANAVVESVFASLKLELVDEGPRRPGRRLGARHLRVHRGLLLELPEVGLLGPRSHPGGVRSPKDPPDGRSRAIVRLSAGPGQSQDEKYSNMAALVSKRADQRGDGQE